MIVAGHSACTRLRIVPVFKWSVQWCITRTHTRSRWPPRSFGLLGSKNLYKRRRSALDQPSLSIRLFFRSHLISSCHHHHHHYSISLDHCNSRFTSLVSSLSIRSRFDSRFPHPLFMLMLVHRNRSSARFLIYFMHFFFSTLFPESKTITWFIFSFSSFTDLTVNVTFAQLTRFRFWQHSLDFVVHRHLTFRSCYAK